jgi:hypothetical protein
MIETKHAFERLGLDPSCAARVVQQVSGTIGDSADPIAAAKKMLHDLLGVSFDFKDARSARLIVARAAEMMVRADHKVDDIDMLLKAAGDHIANFLSDPKHAWMWAEAETTSFGAPVAEKKAFVEGIEMKVDVKADGSIKKGGKQVLVAEMYKKNVLEAETPMTNQQFIALVMKELKMTKSGATTYAYNVKKELGEPEGGIVKSKKGRKAKEVVA